MPDHGAIAETQRLDKWLWHARIVKTRSLATQLIAKGKFRVNRERVVKPAFAVKCGDVITTSVFGQLRVVQIAAFSARRGPAAEARLLYVDMTPCDEGEALPDGAQQTIGSEIGPDFALNNPASND